MPSVSQAVQILERVTDISSATIRGIARQLIDDGILPKSVGRKIEAISEEQFIRLLLGVYCSNTIKDATRVSNKYFDLPLSSVAKHTKSRIGIIGDTAGVVMSRMLSGFISQFYDFSDFGDLFLIDLNISQCSISMTRQNFMDDRKSGSVKFFDIEDGISRNVYEESEETSDEEAKPVVIVRIPLTFILRVARLWQDIDGIDRAEDARI